MLVVVVIVITPTHQATDSNHSLTHNIKTIWDMPGNTTPAYPKLFIINKTIYAT